jgi:hypothetical protein
MAKKAKKADRERLRALIEEALVDCYTEDEERVGVTTMVQDNVVCPFKARVIGEEVEVVELRDSRFGQGVDAVCRYKGKKYRIDVNSLEWPEQKPEGFECYPARKQRGGWVAAKGRFPAGWPGRGRRWPVGWPVAAWTFPQERWPRGWHRVGRRPLCPPR